MKKVLVSLFLLLVSQTANALRIDTMLATGDEQGNGVYTLTNDQAVTNFITAEVSKVEVDDKGELVFIPYTKENLEDWDVTVTSPKLILEGGLTKQVGVRSLCGTNCNFDKDRVYQITFSPVPYVPNAEDKTEPSLSINFGYAPLFIIPAKESKVSYEMTYTGDAVHVVNKGNTYIRFMVSKCKQGEELECRQAYTSLSGRVKDFKLPSYLQTKNIEVMVVNHDESYRRQFTLNKNETKRLGN